MASDELYYLTPGELAKISLAATKYKLLERRRFDLGWFGPPTLYCVENASEGPSEFKVNNFLRDQFTGVAIMLLAFVCRL